MIKSTKSMVKQVTSWLRQSIKWKCQKNLESMWIDLQIIK